MSITTLSPQRRYITSTAEMSCTVPKVNYQSFFSSICRPDADNDTDDLHFPTLTVEQTINFAATTRAPSQRQRLGSSLEDYVQSVTDTLLETFGLTHVRNTLVGDAAIRGVSGGEKKRVSICEVLATRARIVSWDK